MTAANYGLVKGSAAPGLTGGTGGKETLNEIGLVPQSVLLIRWADETWNGESIERCLVVDINPWSGEGRDTCGGLGGGNP